MSAYKIETWLKKGYTEEEAKHQIAIRRPTNILYWINKGYTEEEAILMRDSHQKKGAKASKDRPIEDIYASSMRRPEYWIKHGYSEEEAKEIVSNRQRTFSLEKCIEKYGEEGGHRIWKDRQDRWQKTLKSKSEEEILEMNIKKTLSISGLMRRGFSQEEAENILIEKFTKNGIKYFLSVDEYSEFIKAEFSENPQLSVYSLDMLKKKYDYSKTRRFIGWKLSEPFEDFIQKIVEIKYPDGEIAFRSSSSWNNNGVGYINMFVGDKILRSSNEIYFYRLLLEKDLKNNEDFIIEKYYPNSTRRCDFYFPKLDLYVELAGQTSDDYKQLMEYKEKTFGSVLLWKQKDYKPFIEEIICKLRLVQ